MLVHVDDVSNKVFDYIIVGGGTAGLTLAARLDEDVSTTVLVLEAGEANLDSLDILRPAAFGSNFSNQKYAWQHKFVKQKYLNDRESIWQRGKGLGGSSALNFQCWLVPPVADIDDIERLGNPGWNWSNLKKYMDRVTTFVEPHEDARVRVKLDFEGWEMSKSGPLVLSYPPKIDDGDMQVLETFANVGLPVARKPMSGNFHGFTYVPNTLDPKTRTRSYAATAYYLPNKDRTNLSVIVSASVRRVVTKPAADNELIATGVEFSFDGQIYYAMAGKEVILSAGTLQSPHILEQSGIGRRSVLERVKLPVSIDLPGVGENMQEHFLISLGFELRDDVQWDTIDILGDPVVHAEQLELYKQGLGVFSTGLIGFGFVSLDDISPRAQQLFKSMEDFVEKLDPNSCPAGLIEQYRLTLERYRSGSRSPGLECIDFPGNISVPNPPTPGKRYSSIVFGVNHGWSRGTVHSVSNNPEDVPEIDPHYFERSLDLDLLVEGVKFVREKFATTAPFKDMIVGELNPGAEIQSDEQLREWIKGAFHTIWHTAGTCAMLPREKNGVVDHNLKVYGTKNLRVVDLSVPPLHFGTHSQSFVYATAEKGKLLGYGSGAG